MNLRRILLHPFCTLIMVFCAALLVGVRCSTSTEPAKIVDAFPLAVGNQWQYKTETYSSTGDTLAGTFALSVDKDTLVGGEHYFILKFSMPGVQGIPCINRSGSFYEYVENRDIRIIKHPAQVGEKYTRLNATGTQNLFVDVEVLSIDKDIIVPAGTFRCYELQYTFLSTRTIEYVAPGYGLIQQLDYSNNTLNGKNMVSSQTRLISNKIQ